MFNLKKFIEEIKHNPHVIKNRQQEYEFLINLENYDEISDIFSMGDLKDRKLLILFIEEKIKYFKRNNKNLNYLINFIDKLQLTYKSSEIALLQVELALFEWPNNYENFLTDLSIELLNRENYSYAKFENFVFNIHNSTTVTEKRKGELKKALNIVKELYLKHIYVGLEEPRNARLCLEIILLLVEFVEIDGNILYNYFLYLKSQNIHEFDENLSAIIFELSKKRGESKILRGFSGEMADYCEPNMNLSIVLNNYNIPAHSYFYNAILDYRLVDQSIIFWRKHFNIINYEIYIRFINLYCENDEPNDILNFIVRITDEHNEFGVEYLNATVENLNLRIAEFILKTIKRENYLSIKSKHPFVIAYILVKNKDKTAAIYIPQMTDSNEENKLIMRIVEDFKYSYEEYKTIYKYINDMTLSTKEELLMKCIIFMKEKFPFQLTEKTIGAFYFYLRDLVDENELVCSVELFENYFKNTKNLNGIFEIVNLLIRRNRFKKEFLEKIYSNFSSLNLKNLQIFLELLNNLKEYRSYFYKPVFDKLQYEIDNTQEFELLDKVLQRFITILYQNSEYDILIELLSIDDFNTTKRVITLIKNQKISNTDKLLFYILNKYSSSLYVDLHPIFINIILRQIKNGQGITIMQSFKNQGLDQIIESARIEPEKKTKVLLKEYLSDYKAKKLSELSSMEKIKEQKIFFKNSSGNDSSNSVDLFSN